MRFTGSVWVTSSKQLGLDSDLSDESTMSEMCTFGWSFMSLFRVKQTDICCLQESGQYCIEVPEPAAPSAVSAVPWCGSFLVNLGNFPGYQNIIEWSGLEETLQIMKFQAPCHGQGCHVNAALGTQANSFSISLGVSAWHCTMASSKTRKRFGIMGFVNVPFPKGGSVLRAVK